MKKDIHPDYQALEIIMTDGSKFTTYSASKAGKLILDADIKTHPAWNEGAAVKVNQKAGKVAKFNDRFGSSFLSGGGDKKAEEAKVEEKKEDE